MHLELKPIGMFVVLLAVWYPRTLAPFYLASVGLPTVQISQDMS